MAYSWLLFDADGTLFDYETAERKALAGTFADAGLAYTPIALETYRAINSEMWVAFERGEISQPALHLERFRRTMEALGLQTDIAAFAERYITNLSRRPDPIDGALDVIPRLAEKYNLFLITNGIPAVQHGRLSRSPIGPYFAGITISGEVGYPKPDPRIFDAAFAAMGSPPKQKVLIVGDSISADIQGGLDYGIDACWYNHNGRHPGNDTPVTFQIQSLYELEACLQGE